MTLEKAPRPDEQQSLNRTSSTEESYEYRFGLFIKKRIKEGLITSEDDLRTPAVLVDWLVRKKPDLVSASWRTYKAAITNALQKRIDRGLHSEVWRDNAAAALETLSMIAQTGARKKPQPAAGTFAKRKNYPEADARLVHQFLIKERRSEYAEFTALWLRANRLTGLRPHEWGSANVLRNMQGETWLVVKNAKNTNRRGLGPLRRLNISHYTEENIDFLKQWIPFYQSVENNTGWNNLYRYCSRLLHEANRNIWPRRKTVYTLYSPRHQLAADAKALMEREEVAAIMGHASNSTAARHYGKRSQAESLDAMTDFDLAPDADATGSIIGSIVPDIASLRHPIPLPDPALVKLVRQTVITADPDHRATKPATNLENP